MGNLSGSFLKERSESSALATVTLLQANISTGITSPGFYRERRQCREKRLSSLLELSHFIGHDLGDVLVGLAGLLVLVGGVDEDLPLLDALTVLLAAAAAALDDDLGVPQLTDLDWIMVL